MSRFQATKILLKTILVTQMWFAILLTLTPMNFIFFVHSKEGYWCQYVLYKLQTSLVLYSDVNCYTEGMHNFWLISAHLVRSACLGLSQVVLSQLDQLRLGLGQVSSNHIVVALSWLNQFRLVVILGWVGLAWFNLGRVEMAGSVSFRVGSIQL